jgi:hypothetical protein
MTVEKKMQFISALDLPARHEVHVGRTFASAPIPLVGDGTPTQDNVPTADPREPSGFIDNGSLVSFLAGVDRQSQADVLNSMLLAQLAANKKFDREKDTAQWYAFYHDVLENVGWVVQQFAFAKYEVAGTTATVDKVVLDLLTAIGTENGVAVARSTIAALKALGSDDHRLTIFKESSHSAQNGNFQVSNCSNVGGVLKMSLGAFYFTSKQVDTQILFFGWSTSDTTIYQSGQSIVLDRDVYSQVRQSVVQKLGDHAKTFVDDLDI